MQEAMRAKLMEATSAFSQPSGQRRVLSPRSYSGVRRASEQPTVMRASDQATPELRRRFLFRLAVALHTYGSSASRTEYLIERAADRLQVETNIAVFPTLILLAFGEDDGRSEMHLITVEGELDVGKLGRADELANNVGNQEAPLVLSYWRLKAIATSAPEFGKWWRLFSFALSGFMASLLFFEGSLPSACFSSLLGLLVGAMDIAASTSSLFASVHEFMAAVMVSFFARIISMYVKKLNVCYSMIAVPALVELFPGMRLTLGVSEMVAKSHVTGTSRIMHALFSALQLGFGLLIGDRFVWWTKSPSHDSECPSQRLSMWWDIVWFLGYTVATNVLLNARLKQWSGMMLSAGVGYVVSEATSGLGSSASTVLAAFTVGVTGSSYSYITGDLPLAMVLSGILLLVPNGLGVEGIASMFGEDDVGTGMGFVFNMVAVALAITLGLLISKLVQPAALAGSGKYVRHNKSTLAANLEDDAPDVEREHMAI